MQVDFEIQTGEMVREKILSEVYREELFRVNGVGLVIDILLRSGMPPQDKDL